MVSVEQKSFDIVFVDDEAELLTDHSVVSQKFYLAHSRCIVGVFERLTGNFASSQTGNHFSDLQSLRKAMPVDGAKARAFP